VTILLIEHHMDLVMGIADHVIVLDSGVKIAEGTPEAISGNPQVIAAYLGTEAVAASDHRAAPARGPRSDADVLTVDDLRIKYGAIEALKGVSLTVGLGEIVALIGANGAGKTTLMRAVSGLVPLSSGRIVFNGLDLGTVPPHRYPQLGVAQAPEGRLVFADQSVRDNLLLGAYSRRDDGASIEVDVSRQFAMFPRLAERQSQLAGTLSGGEQQMLAIARALMSRPKLLLLDEPSLGLAPLVVQDLFLVIRRLRDEGMTILLVEQLATAALTIADRAYVMETGRITIEGSGDALIADERVRAAYIGL
jgi:ABC-type branched-subunit amino acid transport system ATPase component